MCSIFVQNFLHGSAVVDGERSQRVMSKGITLKPVILIFKLMAVDNDLKRDDHMNSEHHNKGDKQKH
jgi:hypothetical protein